MRPNWSTVAQATECTRPFHRWRPNTVFHAAAYKHVPLIEGNPLQGIRNNVFGTLCLPRGKRALRHRQVHPGQHRQGGAADERDGRVEARCELIVQARAARRADDLLRVRFGNVLGSSGSVIPLFRRRSRQAGRSRSRTRRDALLHDHSGSVAAGDPGGRAWRRTAKSAARYGRAGRVRDLAQAMIELSDFRFADEPNPDGDIDIVGDWAAARAKS